MKSCWMILMREAGHGQIDVSLIKSEIAEIERYIQQAYKIKDDSKTLLCFSAIEQRLCSYV